MGGIFVVLLGGLALACVTACMEYLWTDRAESRTNKVSSLTEIICFYISVGNGLGTSTLNYEQEKFPRFSFISTENY